MMRLIAATVVCLCMALPAAAETTPTHEALFIQAATDHCLTPLIGDGDIVAHATRAGLGELSPADAAKLDANGGRAFTLTSPTPDAVLIVRPGVGCSVAIKRVDFARQISAADRAFDHTSAYRLMDEQHAPDGSINRVYGAEMGGPLTLYLSVKSAPADSDMQAMITMTRRPSTAAQ